MTEDKNTLKDDNPVKLNIMAPKTGLSEETLKRQYVNDDQDNFDPAKLNTIRYSPHGAHLVRPSEVARFMKEALKIKR